jgi:DNA-binding transcriptional ArsR family regulator
MSHSSTADPLGPSGEGLPEDATVVDAPDRIETLLEAVGDAGCRAIIGATGERALSANELSESCDLPLSTTYRKLGLLTDAGLLAERTRVRRSGKHASEYVRLVEDVLVSVDEAETALYVTWRDEAGPADAASD